MILLSWFSRLAQRYPTREHENFKKEEEKVVPESNLSESLLLHRFLRIIKLLVLTPN